MSVGLKNVIVAGGLRWHQVPKSASSSISRALKLEPQRAEDPEDEGPEFRFMVVRHPLERIVSFYTFFCKDPNKLNSNGIAAIGYYTDMPFEECVDTICEKHWHNHHTMKQVDLKGPHNIDLLVKLENLNKYWPELQQRFPSLSNLGHFKKTNHKPWQKYYSPELRNKAEEEFAKDIELYEGAN